MTLDRRTFVTASAGAAFAASLPAAAKPRGSVMDVEHVVILMQENRAFDHYFGSLRGVRGFDDPNPWIQPGGAPVWSQRQDDKDGGDIIRPFHLDTHVTAAGCMKSLDHSWKGSQARWQHWNVWMPEKGPFSMGYMTRNDIPFYYALADQFTICDAYHASIHGPTGPNRLYHFSGSNGVSVGCTGPFNVSNDGVDDNPGADMTKDNPAFKGLPWTPYAARLEQAGISWKVYQEYDNFSDNPLGYFACFRNLDPQSRAYTRARAWVPGSTPENADTSRGEHLIAAFAADVAADRLPQVSWIVAPFHMCEHPDAPPAYGECLTSGLIRALAANPDVWAKTAFILNYDENDGFFDHVVPPVPPIQPDMGASTVDVSGESYQGEPIGLGPRVPLLIVSPWTRGGYVNSQLCDHTSVLRFLERRFGVAEPNISPWRRAVCGDLLSMFDFNIDAEARRDTRWLSHLPSTRGRTDESDLACHQAPAEINLTPPPAHQEPGTRPARTLPYNFRVIAIPSAAHMTLRFVNKGSVAATFIVESDSHTGPWHFTVGAGDTLSYTWLASTLGSGLNVWAAGGFFQRFDLTDAEVKPLSHN